MVKWSGFTKTPGSWATWNSSDRMASPGWYGGPTTCGSKACLWGSVDFQAWNASYKLHTHLAKQMSFQCKKIYILEIKSEFHPKTTCCCNDSARFRFWLGSCQGRSFMHSFDSTWFASLLPVYLFFFLSSIGLTFINAWTCCIYIYIEKPSAATIARKKHKIASWKPSRAETIASPWMSLYPEKSVASWSLPDQSFVNLRHP